MTNSFEQTIDLFNVTKDIKILEDKINKLIALRTDIFIKGQQDKSENKRKETLVEYRNRINEYTNEIHKYVEYKIKRSKSTKRTDRRDTPKYPADTVELKKVADVIISDDLLTDIRPDVKLWIKRHYWKELRDRNREKRTGRHGKVTRNKIKDSNIKGSKKDSNKKDNDSEEDSKKDSKNKLPELSDKISFKKPNDIKVIKQKNESTDDFTKLLNSKKFDISDNDLPDNDLFDNDLPKLTHENIQSNIKQIEQELSSEEIIKEIDKLIAINRRIIKNHRTAKLLH